MYLNILSTNKMEEQFNKVRSPRPNYKETSRSPIHIPIYTHLAPPVYMPPTSNKKEEDEEENCCYWWCIKNRL